MFRNRCLQQGFISNQNITHVLMDGGVLSIPFDRLDDFYSICVQCIKDGENIFVVEQKTDQYNFFLDIDYKDENALDIDEILTICKTIFAKVKKFCSDDQSMIVSISNPKPKDGKIKSGIHLNFPGLNVDQNGSVQLMYHIIQTLNNVYPDSDWFKFVDPSVYGNINTKSKGSGFRMPWSHKMTKHVSCKGIGCDECNNTGKFVEGVYLPICILNKTDVKNIGQLPSNNMLWLLTVRSNTSKVIEIPTAVQIEKKPYKIEGSFTSAQLKNEIDNSELNILLEIFIRKFLQGQERAKVTKVFKNNKNYLVQTNSNFCENLNRNHSSNHVWFLVDTKDKTIYQKCFCRCETIEGRKSGFCRDFSGRKNLLSSKICEIIIPTSKKKK